MNIEKRIYLNKHESREASRSVEGIYLEKQDLSAVNSID